MKLTRLPSIAIACIALGLFGCNSAKEVDSVYAGFDLEVKCVATDGDSEILRAWGKGKDRNAALLQACKNALRTVMFKGVSSGTGGCKVRPLVLSPNAEEKNREYFNAFFADGGEWRKYVAIDEKRGSRKVSKNSEVENWEATVVVDTYRLSHRLAEDKIIKQ